MTSVPHPTDPSPRAASFLSALPQVTWPAILEPNASQRLAVLYQLDQSQWWSPQALRQAQFRQLRELLRHAIRHVPHYQTTLAGVRPDRIEEPAVWASLPLLSRGDLAKRPERLQSQRVPPEHGNVHNGETSGSTGQIVRFRSTDLAQLFWRSFGLREALWHRYDFSQRLMAIRFAPDAAKHGIGGQSHPQWGGSTEGLVQTGPAELHHIHGRIEDFAARMRSVRPGYVLSHPSVLSGLVEHARQHGWKPQGLKGLRSIGEAMDDTLRERCREVFGVPVHDLYTCQEAGYLAVQCPEHDHYHVQAENVLLEVLDAQGRPCAPGEVGRVVVTSLHNFATPLIRYELGDHAEVGEPCACGRGLPVLRRVLGRFRNLVTLPDGRRRWPKLGFEEIREFAVVEKMQLVQLDLQRVAVRLVAPAPLTEAQLARLTQLIRDNLGHPFALDFDYVDDVRNPANGKLEQFISRLPA